GENACAVDNKGPHPRLPCDPETALKAWVKGLVSVGSVGRDFSKKSPDFNNMTAFRGPQKTVLGKTNSQAATLGRKLQLLTQEGSTSRKQVPRPFRTCPKCSVVPQEASLLTGHVILVREDIKFEQDPSQWCRDGPGQVQRAAAAKPPRSRHMSMLGADTEETLKYPDRAKISARPTGSRNTE
ncbi:hypothetical protein J0S82_014439, partial [Galemys pyrenaicus]